MFVSSNRLLISLRIIPLCVMSFFSLASGATSSAEPSAEIVWVESNGKTNKLYLAQYNAQKWNKISTPIYSSENAITAPALGIDKNQNRLLIWTEQRDNKFVLMMASSNKSADRTAWSDAQLFNDYGRENFGASVVRDLTGTIWVFWSASNSASSDIYVSKKVKASWSNPSKINEQNDVPDSRPEARLSEDGNIIVSWSTYNLQSNTYERVSEKINSELTNKINSTPKDSVLAAHVPLPDFLPKRAAAIMHFPNNYLVQSTRVTR